MFSRAPDSASKTLLYSAVFWLLTGSTAVLIAALKLVSPEFLSTLALSYPRLRAAGDLALIFGWLFPAMIAAVFYIVPRLTGARMRSEAGGQAAAWLINVGLAAAITMTILGSVVGHEFLPMPRWFGWVVVLSLLIAAVDVVRTIESRSEERLYVSLWYFTGAMVWGLLAVALGVLPSFAGSRDSIASLFGLNAIVMTVFPAFGMGIAYYVIPRASGRPLYSQRLAQIGFWWLAFIGPLTGQTRAIFGPSQDWLQTLAITASISMLVPVVALVVNLLATLREGWAAVPEHPSIRFALGGTFLWASSVVMGIVAGFRSVSQFMSSTEMVTAPLWIGMLASTLWAAAAATFAFPRLVGRRWYRGHRVTVHLWTTVAAAALMAVGAAGAAFTAGTMWRTGAVIGVPVSAGDRFDLILSATDKFRLAWLAGAGLFVVAAWLFASNLFRSTTLGQPRAVEVVAPDQDLPAAAGIRNSRILTVAVTAVFGISSGVAYAAPIADKTLVSKTNYTVVYPKDTRALEGKNLYGTEGCWYCHTQSVRPVPIDTGLGKITTPDRIAGDVPSVLGLARIGPDLACVGDRIDDEQSLITHLKDPRAVVKTSIMPRYSALSAREFKALAQYLMLLRCGG